MIIVLTFLFCLNTYPVVSNSDFGESSPTATTPIKPGNMTTLELSRDNGIIHNAWCYTDSVGTYTGEEYSLPTGGPWFLQNIMYYVYPGWPDSTYQGFGVACWAIVNDIPGPVVWPTNGIPAYHPNWPTWVNQQVSPNFNLSSHCPEGFVVGIGFLYAYPNCDAFGIDDTGVGPYDWAFNEGYWHSPLFGKGTARAWINNVGNPGVETTTLGQIKTLYR